MTTKSLLLVLLLAAFLASVQADSKTPMAIQYISQSPTTISRPVVSSLRGGTKIYIKVSGHDGDEGETQVFVGPFPCNIQSGGVSDSFITCETTDSGSSNDIYNLYVTIISNKKTIESQGSDYVSYQSSNTPLLSQIFPSAGFSGASVNLYGNHLISNPGTGKDTGDIKQVLLGQSQCSLIDLSQPNYYTYINCIQSSLSQAGNYNITLKLTPGFSVKNPLIRRASLNRRDNFEFTHLPTVSLINQNQGEEGGQKLVITGTGFSREDENNTVSVDGNDCAINEADSNKIVCKLKQKSQTAFAKLSTNSSNQTNGYFAGAGLNYARYNNVYSLDQFVQGIRSGSPVGTLAERGFRADLREYQYSTSVYFGETWKGYFTAPVSGTYTFRGIANYAFSMYLSPVYGSTQSSPTPFIYSSTPTSEWTNFYYDDIATAERQVNLTSGLSYYIEVYHINFWDNFFKIAVDVPNSDQTLPYQVYEVHKLLLNTTLQPEVVVYSMTGAAVVPNMTINLKIVRTQKTGQIYYNVNATINYGCSANEFLNAISAFDTFYPYMPSVTRIIYGSNANTTSYNSNSNNVNNTSNSTNSSNSSNISNSSSNVISDINNASRIDYIVSFYKFRDISLQTENFIVTKTNYKGNFTKKVQTQHSPLINGTFSLVVGGVSLNNNSISYSVDPGTLQGYFRTIQGYENVQVELSTVYGCEYFCTWIISYKGVNSAIPPIVLSGSHLSGGVTSPTITLTIRRPYSSHITFDPIDYRFLNTYSNLPSVIVKTNGLPSVCTGDCSYLFVKVAAITGWSFSGTSLQLSINNTSKNDIKAKDITITINNVTCLIPSSAKLPNIQCTVATINGTLPFTAGIASITVYFDPYGFIQPVQGVLPLSIPLVITSLAHSSGGVNGGSINYVYGSGFSDNASLIQVLVCNKNATVISSTFSLIKFYMPSCSIPGNATVFVQVGAVNDSSYVYNYIGASGPIISSLVPTSSNPSVKTVLKIIGTGFGSNQSAVQVYLSNSTGKVYHLKIINMTNTIIFVGLSGGSPGVFTVQVTLVSGAGDSQPATLGADLFSYSFTITSVTPNSGGFYGGTLLTITGTNFSPAMSDTLVYIGYTLNWFCNIETISATQITCRTPPISPQYSTNETLEVVISTKLTMMNTCPNGNCYFVYREKTLSPEIIYISSELTADTATGGTTMMVKGTNFLFNPSDTCSIVLYQSTTAFLTTPVSCNNSSAKFIVPLTVVAGNYNVKVRNSVGESLGQSLTVSWVAGTPSLTIGSTQGAILNFIGGSGYPSALSSAIYITIYSPSQNKYYDVNVLSCCTNNVLSLLIPPTLSGTTLSINFNTPSATITQYFTSSVSYTPTLLLTSKQTVSPGTNSITVKRSDSLGGSILSLMLISTINNTNNITISNWTKPDSLTYTFSAVLYSGAYEILALTAFGYCDVNSTILVSITNSSIASSIIASYAGDSFTISGVGLSPSSYITINGFKGFVSSFTSTSVTYSIPPFTSQTSQASFGLTQVAKLDTTLLLPFSDTLTNSNASAAIDGDLSTVYGSSNKNCWIGVDVGVGLGVDLDRIKYFPMLDWNNIVQYILQAVFEGSNDNSTWATLGKLDQSIQIGWNNLEIAANVAYRFVRFRHNSTSQCNLAEIELYGVIYTNQNVSLSSQLATVIYKDGYNTLSYTNKVEFRQDHTPTVLQVVPPYGDIFGGYQITLTGTNLGFAPPTILIDQIPCVLVSYNQSSIVCTPGARPNIPVSTSFTVAIGTSVAVINQAFLYVLKWSDSRTWGVDLPPIDGDLVFVPAGMTLLVDQNTPNLIGLAVQNGTLVFPNDTDVTVSTGFITMNGGKFIAGSEASPLTSNLQIILYGNIFGTQQPIFGNKAIGCLDCQFSMYGKPRNPVWTTLANTISPGDTNFTVKSVVDWQVGEIIVIASTSFAHNQSEEKIITAVNGSFISVDTPFLYQHVSLLESYGTDKLLMSAEVGLLSRNIKITGDNSSEVSQYGAHMLFSRSLSNSLQVQVAYTEFTKCGQPQIPGRYCMFFSTIGDAPLSYVRGNSVYNSYARLVTLFKTNYLTIENNIGYLIRGHNIFLQSGSETHNIIRNNLIVSSLISTNMLQTDFSVASYWISHPTNDFYGNHAAGGDYYGVNYMTDSVTTSAGDACPYGNRLGLVTNNVVHSNMRYGLRIYQLYARLYPCLSIRETSSSTDQWTLNPSIPSVFHNFTIYKNMRGVVAEQVGNLMFNNFTVAENYELGIEVQVANFTKEMISANNSVIVGVSNGNSMGNSTIYNNMMGIVSPRTGQFNLTGVRFYSFPASTTAFITCSQCNNNQFLTNIGNQIYITKVSYSSVSGTYLRMLGSMKEIIYDLDGSLSPYFFNSSLAAGTVVYGYQHIANFHTSECHFSINNSSGWNGMIMCNPSLTIRRITFTNIIGANYYYYGFYWANMYVLPLQNATTPIINFTNINQNYLTSVPPTYPTIEKPNSYSLPYVTGNVYQIWWDAGIDYDHLSIFTTPIYTANDLGIVFKIPYTLNRQLYNIGPMRRGVFPTANDLVYENVDLPVPSTCINGEYRHVNDEGARMLSICQSGKNKTAYEYTEVNAVFCKYVCPVPPAPKLPSSAGMIVKQTFVRYWSNASQWPNGTIPGFMQDVYVNANWTILLDMNPNPANFMLIDGTVIADDTRDIFITAHSIHIRAGNISAGNPSAPFTHNLVIQINNTENDKVWMIDPIIFNNKFIAVTGSLNLFGVPPSSVNTDLTATALAGSTKIFVRNSGGWAVGDQLALSPSYSRYNEYERVIISSINTDGSIIITTPLKYNHYGNAQSISTPHGSINVNTQVGHLTRSIKIVSGPDSTWGVNLLIYGYYDDKIHRIGSTVLQGVEINGGGQPGNAAALQFLNVLSGVASSITGSSIFDCLDNCMDVRNSNRITFSNNVIFNSRAQGVSATSIDQFIFTNNLITGTDGSCFSTYDELSSSSSVTNNFCLGAASYGFALPLIRCSEMQTNLMANNTAGSCGVGFVLNNIQTIDRCKAFSYIKAYACGIGQMVNPVDTSQLKFQHFVLLDNQRGATLKFGDGDDSLDSTALLSYSYINPISRTTCTECYGNKAISCSSSIGLRLLSVSSNGDILPADNIWSFDDITTAEVFNSRAYLTNVVFDNFRANYNSFTQCQNNFALRPHPKAYDAVAQHTLFSCSCPNCDNDSYIYAQPNDQSLASWQGGCGTMACTGKSNYLILDEDGTFLGFKGTIIPDNKLVGDNEANCNYSTHMNAHICNRTDFGVLGYQSVASDYNTRIMWPVSLFYEGSNYTTTTNGWREWDWIGDIPQNHRLGRFLSIVKLNSTYNMTFTSMAPTTMEMQIQQRLPSNNNPSYILVKLRYPLPNMIRIYANDVMVDPILLTDTGLRRTINTSICGDNIYYYTNYTTNFIITEEDCLVKVELIESIQLTTHFAMTPSQFFVSTVMSSYIDNLCALLSITDRSRVKIVGVYTGSTIVKSMILPASNSTGNSTSSNSSSNSTEPALPAVQATINSLIASGTYSSSMFNATGYQVLTSQSAYYPSASSLSSSGSSSSGLSTNLLIGIIIGTAALIIFIILTVLYFRNKKVGQQAVDESFSQQEKEVAASDAIVLSNDSLVDLKEPEIARDQKNRKNRVTNNIRRNRRLARANTNLQIKQLELDRDYYDFEE